MSDLTTYKVLGVAEYEAHWIHKSLLVRLTAKGLLPCSNYHAQLEQRPERVVPPMWDMVFFVENYCDRVVKSFSAKATVFNANRADTISVRDALGEHQVPITYREDQKMKEPLMVTAADLDQYIVYAKLPKVGDTHHGCIMVPADTFVTAIHYKAFGPSPKADCEKFVRYNCAVDLPDLAAAKLLGGEIPWPWAVEE